MAALWLLCRVTAAKTIQDGLFYQAPGRMWQGETHQAGWEAARGQQACVKEVISIGMSPHHTCNSALRNGSWPGAREAPNSLFLCLGVAGVNIYWCIQGHTSIFAAH